MTQLGLRSALLSAVPGISHGFFGAIGGTSPAPWRGLNVAFNVGDAKARVEENLARVRFQLGVGRHALFVVSQVHKDRVVVVEEAADREAIGHEEADALFTSLPDIAVGVRTADCAPVLLAARDGSAVAAVHAGWRGAVGGVIEAAVKTFADAGVNADQLVAAVGPCIGQRAFEVGPEVIEAAAARVDVDGLVVPGRDDRQHLHLEGLCLRVLERAGVEAEGLGVCTVEDVTDDGLPKWFSHRRDQGKTGRQMSAIARAEPPELHPETFA
jgi:YfiH family protein